MNQTKHVQQRSRQRGIPQNLLELALAHGTPVKEKYVLGRKEIQARILEIQHEKRVLMKAMDKGGIVVVEDNNTLITTYNLGKRPRS